VNPDLDPFNTNPNGPSHYSVEFQAKYFKARADRMHRLIDTALKRQQEMKGDDDVFLIPRGEGARTMELDLGIHHATLKPQKLLKNDGTIVTQIVESVRPLGRLTEKQNESFTSGTRLLPLSPS
jgi:hypothetical protein